MWIRTCFFFFLFLLEKEDCTNYSIIDIRSCTYWFFTGAGMRGLFCECIYYSVYRFWFAAKILFALSHQVRIFSDFVQPIKRAWLSVGKVARGITYYYLHQFLNRLAAQWFVRFVAHYSACRLSSVLNSYYYLFQYYLHC